MKPMGFSPCGNALEKIAGTEGYGLQPLHKLLRTLRALYAAKKLHFSGFVTGHDFSRADKPIKPMGFSPLRDALSANSLEIKLGAPSLPRGKGGIPRS
jgi:hypothetical protein